MFWSMDLDFTLKDNKMEQGRKKIRRFWEIYDRVLAKQTARLLRIEVWYGISTEELILVIYRSEELADL